MFLLRIFISTTMFCSIYQVALCFDFESTLGHIKPSVSAESQADAVENLIRRLIPNEANKFDVKIKPDIAENGKDVFKIKSVANDHIQIIGTTGVVAATGFHHYLKYYCFCHVSWQTQQLNLPELLPEVNITVALNDRFRYYQNVCTTSYSFVWWDWQQWEKHIDWMVLNSFNLVLAFNGQEAIWQRVYEKLNMTQEEIDEQFSGPAFLSWLRMGNIRGWAGPLSISWHNRSLLLQKLILARMREFGIISVLPGFSGYVPKAFKKLYPTASMTKGEIWNDFNDTYCCPYLLDPTEELFNIVGTLFLQELIEEFGTDHVYNIDTFNEMTPSTSDLTYLSNIGKAIFKTITDVDKEGIWLMQNWLFVHDFFYWTQSRAKAMLQSVPEVSIKLALTIFFCNINRLLQGWMFYSESDYWLEERVEAFLKSVEMGKIIVLDLQSEQFPQYGRLQQYFGQPYIWCMLHNFGGTLGMFGSLEILNQEPFKARNAVNSTMIGTGLTPEGINQNYVVYDFMTEMAWRNIPTNMSQWISDFTVRRYGRNDASIRKAWGILKNTVYNFQGLEKMRGKHVITRSPTLNIQVWSWYETSDLMEAWDLLLSSSNKFAAVPTYLHDLVDITRQVLQVLGDDYYKLLVPAFRKKDIGTLQDLSSILLKIFDSLEEILATNEAFLLGPWLESARRTGSSNLEADLFEYDARNQITLWGPEGEISDYANKQWSGVVSNYFKPRWEVFLNYLNKTVVNKLPYNQTEIKTTIFNEVEKPFTFDKTVFPNLPTGDTIAVAKKIHGRFWVKKRSKVERSSEEFSSDTENYINYEEYRYQHYEHPKVNLIT